MPSSEKDNSNISWCTSSPWKIATEKKSLCISTASSRILHMYEFFTSEAHSNQHCHLIGLISYSKRYMGKTEILTMIYHTKTQMCS